MTPEFGHLDHDETPFLEPAPDEEAWEAYLQFAQEQLGADGTRALTNRQLAALEEALGATLPFEVGLLLVMGPPDDDTWLDWRDDPEGQLDRWRSRIRSGIASAVVEDGRWWPMLGPRPATTEDRVEAALAAVDAAPPLFPLTDRHAIPLGIADGFDDTSGNPVLKLDGGDVVVHAADLADWLHRDHGVPLPTWERPGDRRFPFWSDLVVP